MSTCDIALIREQGINFAVVCVADQVINSSPQRERTLQAWTYRLGVPVALMGSHAHETYGRRDIVRWLSNRDPELLPWRRATLS